MSIPHSQSRAGTKCLEQTYQKHSMPVLRVDAHFTVIESTIKGYLKWRKRRAEVKFEPTVAGAHD